MASMADAQYRCMQAAILDQELAGIDVITGGEMHWRTHNRHSPPNAMLNYYTRYAIIHHGRLDPGVHLIGKPYTPSELGARIRELLDEGA